MGKPRIIARHDDPVAIAPLGTGYQRQWRLRSNGDVEYRCDHFYGSGHGQERYAAPDWHYVARLATADQATFDRWLQLHREIQEIQA